MSDFPVAPADTIDDLPSSRLSFAVYQEQASTTARYPGQGTFVGLAYAALGLGGEAGETSEQIKKIWRDDGADIRGGVLKALDELAENLKKPSYGHAEALEHARYWIDKAFEVPVTDERREKIIKELGDTLWYAAQICTELGVDMSDVAQINLDKLAARRAANKIHGEGSDR
jgi:NTP pyrophosphatase (non-canonical NTP hydrolase)